MKTKKKGNNWTAYYNPETGRYFAEIMYTSREGREQFDYEITKDIYSRLGTFEDDIDNERLIKTARMISIILMIVMLFSLTAVIASAEEAPQKPSIMLLSGTVSPPATA